MIAYSGRSKSPSVSSIEELSEEEFATSFKILYSKCKEACSRISILKKTINVLQKKTKELGSTITNIENEVSSQNSKIDNLMQLESNLKTSSNSLNGTMQFGEMFGDMKIMDLETSMKEMKIILEKGVIP